MGHKTYSLTGGTHRVLNKSPKETYASDHGMSTSLLFPPTCGTFSLRVRSKSVNQIGQSKVSNPERPGPGQAHARSVERSEVAGKRQINLTNSELLSYRAAQLCQPLKHRLVLNPVDPKRSGALTVGNPSPWSFGFLKGCKPLVAHKTRSAVHIQVVDFDPHTHTFPKKSRAKSPASPGAWRVFRPKTLRVVFARTRRASSAGRTRPAPREPGPARKPPMPPWK